MRVFIRILAALLLCSGCARTGYVRASEIEGIVDAVCERHDKLCDSPEAMRALGLDHAKGESYKRSSALLRDCIKSARKNEGAKGDAVLERKDAPQCPAVSEPFAMSRGTPLCFEWGCPLWQLRLVHKHEGRGLVVFFVGGR